MNWQQLLIALGFLAVVGGIFWAVLAKSRVARAVFARNVASYFSGVLGYLFIVVFVVAAGFLAFSPQFFTNNLLNLDQLSAWFPMLLLFLVPAITMTAWSDEKKLGTDELLFTLPGSDLEILLGKYLAVLAVYTIALAFSLTLWLWLAWIGDPDWGLIFTTYVGYWVAGAALLSAGMFASVLTSSATVAFVLAAAICAIPVYIGYAAPGSQFVQGLSLREQTHDFAMGLLPLTGLLYFVSLAVFMLYLNLVFISKRHWAAARQTNMGVQFAVRTLALGVFLIGLNAIATQANSRIDMTAEELYSLSPTTRTLLDKVSEKRPVTIQAFLSPEVPREYVPVRKRLIGLLREYDRLGGNRLDVRFVEVKPYSEEADEARHFGITPVRLMAEREGRRIEEDVFLGVVVTSSYDEVVVPFFGAGTPLEYELTRSVSTVSAEERPTVGILTTDAQLLSGQSEWQIVTELKQQYNVEEVSADAAIDDKKYDVLIAVLPSSLTQPQMNHLVDYVRKGRPTLIFDDPFPYVFNNRFGVSNAPRQEKPRPGGMMGMMGGSPPAEAKADGGRASTLLSALGLAWDNGQVVWDTFNPHPEFYAVVPDEFVFIGPQSGVRSAFSQKSEITSGLQEVLLAYAGTVRPRSDSDHTFEPLMKTSANSGLLDWNDFTQDSFDPTRMQPTRQLVPNPPRRMDEFAHVVAYHIQSPKKEKEKGGVNAVYVSDIDMISDWFFYERQRGESSLKLDNVTFVLNAVDVLAGQEDYIDLRKRRPEHRTLRAVEARTAKYIARRNEKREQADKDAEQQLEAAKERFEKQRQAIEEDTSLDEQTRQIMLRNIQATEQRRLEVDEANIERAKQREVEQIKAETERDIARTIARIKWLAILTLPIPAFVLGAVMFSWRLADERRDIAASRRVRDR